MAQRTKPIPLVVSADDMDDKTFIMHFNNRHADQLPGLPNGILPNIDEVTLTCYRDFHEALHRWQLEMEEPHEHKQP